ncbi:hypothetical protein HDV01_005284 [Terramyces sp. JEL0728]|nr:hypothetical protein HDV01_005284 [Terramyces sp. JEL0728]
MQKRKQATKTIQQKELQQIKEICFNLKCYIDEQQDDLRHRREQDYLELRSLTEKSKKDDEFSILGIEASMAIINLSQRKTNLRKRLYVKLTDERELNNIMNTHKEGFTQFIWKRRLQTKRDLRALFQSGPGIIGRLGDLIAESNLEAIQSFERSNWARLCNHAIAAGLCEKDDIEGDNRAIQISASRYEFRLISPKDVEAEWNCAFATSGPWGVKLYAKSLVRDVVVQTMSQLKMKQDSPAKDTDFSYIHIIARLIDLYHPSHQLQASVLAYPLYGTQILKRRISSLGYNFGGANEDLAVLDFKTVSDIVKQINTRLETEMSVYFEFSVPFRANWRAGLSVAGRVSARVSKGYPGNTSFSFGFDNNGELLINDTRFPYTTSLCSTPTLNHTKTIGILTDLYEGNICLVVENQVLPPAFGKGAMAFDAHEQERQRFLILKQQLLPHFALLDTDSQAAQEKPTIQANFGQSAFAHVVNATALINAHKQFSTKNIDMTYILDGSGYSVSKDKISQEEDEKINNSLEKNYFKVSLLPDMAKSFSQFPPSVYRRSLAATKIQRAWRRYQGRKMRARIRREQYLAACTIQRMARRKLRALRELKNLAAVKIQKVWRRKMYIWIALLRCIYRQTILTLHTSAKIIQQKWRHWHQYKNSPLASKYQTKMEDLEKAVSVIINWWRPLYARLIDIRSSRKRTIAATTIQRIYRGYKLRSLLRNDIREKLVKIGRIIAKARYLETNLETNCCIFVLHLLYKGHGENLLERESFSKKSRPDTWRQPKSRQCGEDSGSDRTFHYASVMAKSYFCSRFKKHYTNAILYSKCTGHVELSGI